MNFTMMIPVTQVDSNQDFVGIYHPHCTKCHISEHSNLFHQILNHMEQGQLSRYSEYALDWVTKESLFDS
jgi:hypothetical protein